MTDLLFAGMSASSLQLQWYPGNSIHLDGIQIVNTSPNLLPMTTPLSIAANSTFDLNGEGQQVASLSDYSATSTGSLINSNTTVAAVLTLSASGGATSFSGLIAGGGTLGTVNLVVSGSGTQILAGANTFTGATTISGGTLQLGTGASGQDGSINSTSGVTNNSALVYNLYGSQTAAYAIGGSGSLTKTGGGLLVLTASNTYTGGATINGGTLNINSDGNLGGANAGVVFTNNATLQQAGTASVSLGSGRGISINNNVTATIDTQANAMSIAGVISGSGGLTKVGSGPLTLSGNNTYFGPTNVNVGSLVVNGALNSSGTLNLASGAVLSGSGSAGQTFVASGGLIDVHTDTASTLTLAALTFSSSGTISLPALTSTSSVALQVGSLTPSGGTGSVGFDFPLATVANGLYRLIANSSGTIGGTGSGAFTVAQPPVLGARQNGSLVNNNGEIDYSIVGTTPYWNGTQADWTGTQCLDPPTGRHARHFHHRRQRRFRRYGRQRLGRRDGGPQCGQRRADQRHLQQQHAGLHFQRCVRHYERDRGSDVLD